MPPSISDDAVRRARAYLLRVAEPPAVALTALITEHGPVKAAEIVRAGTGPNAILEETSTRRTDDRIDSDFAAAADVGARLVIPEDDEWPAQFAVLGPERGDGARWASPPVALWVRGAGSLDDLLDRAVTVIGARAATGYGEHVSAEFGFGLTAEQVTVVTGGCYGIDAAALRGAIAGNGASVAILACGIDVMYPSGHGTLFNQVVENGLLVSEYPPTAPPARHRFLVRNRLLAASPRVASLRRTLWSGVLAAQRLGWWRVLIATGVVQGDSPARTGVTGACLIKTTRRLRPEGLDF